MDQDNDGDDCAASAPAIIDGSDAFWTFVHTVLACDDADQVRDTFEYELFHQAWKADAVLMLREHVVWRNGRPHEHDQYDRGGECRDGFYTFDHVDDMFRSLKVMYSHAADTPPFSYVSERRMIVDCVRKFHEFVEIEETEKERQYVSTTTRPCHVNDGCGVTIEELSE